MTDRIDLDDQLYAQFSQCADFLRQTPVQAESKEHLKSLLDGRSANGIIFTTMFKFERGEKALSERRNIVVMADEAHRGQYGFDEKIVMSENENGEKEAHTVIGNARIIHDALPNATFIGFTGTPISAKDRNTREVFGDYIDVYDMTQAVENGVNGICKDITGLGRWGKGDVELFMEHQDELDQIMEIVKQFFDAQAE